MQSMAVRFVKFAGGVLFVLATLSGLVFHFAPIPKSPPLIDEHGVILDAVTEANLIEIVFDAARSDDLTTVTEYLNEGFSPNVRSPRGDTLLTVAAYHDSADVVQVLLAQPRIDIEARNRMGLTAVAAAAFKGYERPLRMLIAAGANVNSSNEMNQTALMFASISGRTRAVEILMASGADKERTDSLGNTAISVARTQGADAVVGVLLKDSKP